VATTFGPAVANLLGRFDLRPCGSFGGEGRAQATDPPTKLEKNCKKLGNYEKKILTISLLI
jgi:hypothetical protein